MDKKNYISLGNDEREEHEHQSSNSNPNLLSTRESIDSSNGGGSENSGSLRRRQNASSEHHSEKRKAAGRAELFGFMPFAETTLNQDDDPSLYEPPKRVKEIPAGDRVSLITAGNVIWVILFGWWLALTYTVVSGLLFVTYWGIPHAKVCWQLKNYFFWPFGKYIVRIPKEDIAIQDQEYNFGERQGLIGSGGGSMRAPRQKTSSDRVNFVVGSIAWAIFAVPILCLCHCLTFFICWMSVVFIPMAKVNKEAIKMLFHSPRSYRVFDDYPGASTQLLLCTYEAFNLHYWKYKVMGVNVCLINFIPFIIATIIVGYAVPEHLKPPTIAIFFSALLSIIPTAYFIGLAVSSISAQSNFAVGAVLNATFGSIVELILYTTAIRSGGLDELVQASITGALLSTLLLIPGLSMIAGGLKWKEQRFNVSAAGVSNVLLIVSVIGAFTPTIFYNGYGQGSLSCTKCIPDEFSANSSLNCGSCTIGQIEPHHIAQDPVFIKGAQPLIYAISFVLPLAYIIGLVFTLKTHSYLYEEKQHHDGEEEEAEGETPLEWSKWFSLLVLLAATFSFALVSDELVDAIQPTLKTLNISQAFVGVFFVGVASSSAEIVNAVNFALANNIALSIEIGAAGTVQAVLIQIPALVLISVIMHTSSTVTFIFPPLNLFAIVFSVIVNNYLSINGKSNYFEGAALVLIYILFVLAFFFIPS